MMRQNSKSLTTAFFVCLLPILTAGAQSLKTTLSVQTRGYRGDMVYFDCEQTPLIRAEFHANEGEEHVYSFDTDEPVMMIVNGRTRLFLHPGDSLHADVIYEERQTRTANIGGTERAVVANRLMQSVADTRRTMRYKQQLLGCAALNIAPKDRISDSRTLLSRVKAMVEAADGLSAEAAVYALAETEGSAYLSFMEYPVMYADVRKVPVERQEIGDYARIMDGFTVRDDKAALICPEYVSMLMRYCLYCGETAAKASGKDYKQPSTLEEMYASLAGQYSGDVRDAVLYTLICNYIRAGKDVERADAVIADYKKNYNKSAKYAATLDCLMR